jgi:GAF domain-containing protein
LFLLALANLLFPRRGALVYGIVLFVIASTLIGLEYAGIAPELSTANDAVAIYLLFTFTLFSVAFIMAISSNNYRRSLDATQRRETELRERNKELDNLRNSLELRVTERTTELEIRATQLQAIASVARAIASVQDMDILLPDITKLVSDQFGFYHVGIFLLDEKKENAILRAANSQGGKVMLERKHQLGLDVNSLVGFAASRSEPRIALDVGTDAVFFDNPDLPETRSEMALPLRVAGNVIGVLDVQSKQANAFTQNDIALLSTLSDQIAVAIENTRLFGESREALKTAEESFSRYVKREWSSYVRQAKNTGYTYDGNRTLPLEKREKQKNSQILPQTGRLTLQKDTSELTVPIRFRGQIIGYMDVKPKGERKWSQDDLLLLEAAAERAAISLENARLVESAERRASRERTIGEISAKIGAVSDLDAIMQAAVEELGRKIGSSMEVIFELGTEQD